MPDFVGGIKFPVPGDAYNSAYGEPQWWKDLAETAAAQIAMKADAASVAEYRRHATGTFNADNAAEGVDLIRTTVTHSNLPSTGGSWALRTEKQAGDVVWQEAVSWGLIPEVWRRIYGSYWSDWVRIDAGAVEVPEVVFPVEAPSQSVTGFKTVPVALTVGGGVHDFPATEGGVRIPVNFGATIKRWRLHIRNINPRQGTPGEGTVSVTGVYIGRHGGNGTVAGGNTLVSNGITSSSGSDMVTPWTDAVIDASYEYLISYGWTATAQPKKVVGGAYTTATASGAFNNAEPATRSVDSPLDVWIEAEVEADVPVIAAFGDSLTSGVGAVLPVFNSWLSAYCRTQKAIPVHYSASGDTMAGWSDPDHYKWTRWEGLTRPDAVVHAMGSNDVFGGATLAQMQDRFNTTAAILAEKVTPVIHAATILPRNGSSWDAMEQVRRDYNTWVKGRVRAQHNVAAAISADDDNIRAEYNADGIHLNAAGYSAMAAAITGPVTSGAVTDSLAALKQDTGWRDITAELINGWTAAQVLVRREGRWGHLRFVSLDGTQATDSYFAVGLAGFLAGGQNLPITIGTVPATIWVRNSADRLSLPTTSPVSATTVQASQYLGDVPFPVSLPGTPA